MSSTTPEAVRPAVYGRNYSYFSHRIFVAFMPEDLHEYLHSLMHQDSVVKGTADAASEGIDMHIVRWVLLHRSQMNVLSLNRQIESWRGPDDTLLLPSSGQLRTEHQYRMDITLQFALELELATGRDHPLLQNRPRLQLALLDAAYYVSRRRADQDRDGATEQEADLDLSQNGRDAFEHYLVQRMNLDEDRPSAVRKDETTAAPGPLSEAEINWLYGVAIGVARTLSSSATQADLRRRWSDCLGARWAALKMPIPDNALFEALLTEEESPLRELPLAATSPGLEEGTTESLRFQWRVSPFGETPWAQSLKGIAQNCLAERRFIEYVDGVLQRAMYGEAGSAGLATGPELQPLRMLSDRYRVLPTTPAWAAVAAAMESMRQAEKGLGNVDALRKERQVLRQYATMLRTDAAAGATVLALVAAAGLAGTLFDSDRGGSPPADLRRPRLADWAAALAALCEGLALEDVDLPTANIWLRQVRTDLINMGYFPSSAMEWPLAASPPSSGEEEEKEPAQLLYWPSADWLESAVLQAFEAGRRGAHQFGNLEGGHLARSGWQALEQRLRVLATGIGPLPPASGVELVCGTCRVGPGALLPLNLHAAGFRAWTLVLLQILQHATSASGGRAGVYAPPITLAAHALERLGARSLEYVVQRSLVKGFALPDGKAKELIEYVERHNLWGGSGFSSRLALVLGPAVDSLTDGWRPPPRGGLVLAATEAELAGLSALGLDRWTGQLVEPLRVAIELASVRGPETDNFVRWLQTLPGQSGFIRIWLSRVSPVTPQFPLLVGPASADELWSVGPATLPVPPAAS